MRKKSTRLLSAALAVCMTVTVLPMSAFASGEEELESSVSSQETTAALSEETGDVAIDETNFPDLNFRKYVEDKFDYDDDGFLSQRELAAVAAVKELDFGMYALHGEKISTLKGIEYFTSLEKLSCSLIQLSELDVSQNKALEYLNCSQNQLSELNVSNNLALEYLNCSRNQLSALDVSNHRALTKLYCDTNQLSKLNVSGCSALTKLDCYINNLSELDVSSCSALTELDCEQNQLSELDVSQNSKLSTLDCEFNKLSKLDVRSNSALTSLGCEHNDLSALDVSQNKALEGLYCDSNQLRELDVSQNSALEYLHCRSNQLRELDVNSNPALKVLYCDSNQLTSLNIGERDFRWFGCLDNSYNIVVDENNCYNLSKLQGNFDASKVENPQGGSFDPVNKILTVDENATEVTYTYNCGTNTSDEPITAEFKLIVDRDPQEPAVPDAPAGGSGTDNIQGAIAAVVVGAAAGAIIYEAGTGIYRVINMPGIPMPSNRIELAELLWERAGKPEPVSTALYSDIDEGDTDAQKAARWAVEQDLMKDNSEKNTFNPYFPVSKLRTCLTWNAAKEKGLFAKTEE